MEGKSRALQHCTGGSSTGPEFASHAVHGVHQGLRWSFLPWQLWLHVLVIGGDSGLGHLLLLQDLLNLEVLPPVPALEAHIGPVDKDAAAGSDETWNEVAGPLS